MSYSIASCRPQKRSPLTLVTPSYVSRRPSTTSSELARMGRRFDSPRQWLLAADFLSEGPQRLQRMLPRMRIDVREERALPLPLGREWLLGRETCPTGYHVGRGVRHQILAWLDSGEEAGTSP